MARRTFFALLAIFSWFFAIFFGIAEVFSVGDDGFLELQRVSGCGGIVRSSGGGLATRQAGNVLLGGASGAGGLLLNTKASQEAACSRAPAAIVPVSSLNHATQV